MCVYLYNCLLVYNIQAITCLNLNYSNLFSIKLCFAITKTQGQTLKVSDIKYLIPALLMADIILLYCLFDILVSEALNQKTITSFSKNYQIF